jgi:phosphoribosylformylglycinamidine synthase
MLFGESASRILVSVAPEQQASWESYLQQQFGEQAEAQGRYWQKLGIVKGENADLQLLIADNRPIINVTMSEMSDRFSNAIERRLRV